MADLTMALLEARMQQAEATLRAQSRELPEEVWDALADYARVGLCIALLGGTPAPLRIRPARYDS